MVPDKRVANTRRLSTSAAILLMLAVAGWGQQLYQPELDPLSPAGIPFRRYFTKDRFGRRITFYAGLPNNSATQLPLALFILGSGAYSQFLIKEGKILHAHRDFLDALNGRARLLIVEKPGVKFGNSPGCEEQP